MFLRKKWLLSLLFILFILIFSLSLVGNPISAHPPTPVPLSGSKTPLVSNYSKTNVLLAFSKSTLRKQRLTIEALVQGHEVRSLGVDNIYLITVPSGHVLSAVRTLR